MATGMSDGTEPKPPLIVSRERDRGRGQGGPQLTENDNRDNIRKWNQDMRRRAIAALEHAFNEAANSQLATRIILEIPVHGPKLGQPQLGTMRTT